MDAASGQHLGAEDQPLATAITVLSIDCVTRRGGTKGAGIRGRQQGSQDETSEARSAFGAIRLQRFSSGGAWEGCPGRDSGLGV